MGLVPLGGLWLSITARRRRRLPDEGDHRRLWSPLPRHRATSGHRSHGHSFSPSRPTGSGSRRPALEAQRCRWSSSPMARGVKPRGMPRGSSALLLRVSSWSAPTANTPGVGSPRPRRYACSKASRRERRPRGGRTKPIEGAHRPDPRWPGRPLPGKGRGVNATADKNVTGVTFQGRMPRARPISTSPTTWAGITRAERVTVRRLPAAVLDRPGRESRRLRALSSRRS